MLEKQPRLRLAQNARNSLLSLSTLTRTYPSIQIVDTWDHEFLEKSAVIRLLQIIPSIWHRRPYSAGKFSLSAQRFEFVRLPSQELDDAPAKQHSLCVKTALHIRAKIQPLQLFLKCLELRPRPLA